MIKVITSFGYFKDAAGNVVLKAELPAGDHASQPDCTYHEVNTAAELAAVEIYIDPEKVSAAEYEKKISAQIRKVAIQQLKIDGQLPPDYPEAI